MMWPKLTSSKPSTLDNHKASKPQDKRLLSMPELDVLEVEFREQVIVCLL